MKQLNIYLNGLLDKGSKSQNNSSVIDSAMDYIQSGKLFRSLGEIKCTANNDTINIYTDNRGPILNLDNLNTFVSDFPVSKTGIRKIHFNAKLVINYSTPQIFNQDIIVSGDWINMYTLDKVPVKGLNIECSTVHLGGDAVVKNCNINSHIIFMSDTSKTIGCNLKSDYIFMVGSYEKPKIKTLSKLGFITGDKENSIIFTELTNDNELINIDPIKELGLKNWAGDTIVIGDSFELIKSNKYALITKNKSTISDAKNIYKMANGWYVGICEGLIKDYLNSL